MAIRDYRLRAGNGSGGPPSFTLFRDTRKARDDLDEILDVSFGTHRIVHLRLAGMSSSRDASAGYGNSFPINLRNARNEISS